MLKIFKGVSEHSLVDISSTRQKVVRPLFWDAGRGEAFMEKTSPGNYVIGYSLHGILLGKT